LIPLVGIKDQYCKVDLRLVVRGDGDNHRGGGLCSENYLIADRIAALDQIHARRLEAQPWLGRLRVAFWCFGSGAAKGFGCERAKIDLGVICPR
jgi:hypothetical protein